MKDGKCLKIDATKGPWMSEEDYVSCVYTKPVEGTGEDWTGDDNSAAADWSDSTYGGGDAEAAGYNADGVNADTTAATKAGDESDASTILTKNNHDENGHHQGH